MVGNDNGHGTGPSRTTTLCVDCGAEAGSGYVTLCSECGGMIDVRYANVTLYDSTNPFVRFRDLLPVEDADRLPADASFTPVVHAAKLGEALDLPWLYLKDETRLPTGTTKDRMAAVALAYLYEKGVRAFCISSTGNSSTAFARAIRRFPGLVMYLFTASAFRHRLQFEPTEQVVHFLLQDASFVEAFDAAKKFAGTGGHTAERGFFNPGRREGLKLAWLEAAEQVPRPIDWYVQAVSSAMGVYGVFKGARELRDLGRIDRLPRLLCVQQETCAPMASAWAGGSEKIRPSDVVKRPSGIAESILRGDPWRVYPYVRRIVIESRGTFAVVTEAEIRQARRWIEELEGLPPCFSAAAAMAGLAKLRREGGVPREETVLVNLTGSDRGGTASTEGAVWLERSGDGWKPRNADVTPTGGPP